MRDGSVTPRLQSTKNWKRHTVGAVTSTLSHNTRYARRVRADATLGSVPDVQDHQDAPQSPITAIKIGPRERPVDEKIGQNVALLEVMANHASGKEEHNHRSLNSSNRCLSTRFIRSRKLDVFNETDR